MGLVEQVLLQGLVELAEHQEAQEHQLAQEVAERVQRVVAQEQVLLQVLQVKLHNTSEVVAHQLLYH
jgi:hypothetical protein